jgi:hypothetical protein
VEMRMPELLEPRDPLRNAEQIGYV